jgi:hypothetical protein
VDKDVEVRPRNYEETLTPRASTQERERKRGLLHKDFKLASWLRWSPKNSGGQALRHQKDTRKKGCHTQAEKERGGGAKSLHKLF